MGLCFYYCSYWSGVGSSGWGLVLIAVHAVCGEGLQ